MLWGLVQLLNDKVLRDLGAIFFATVALVGIIVLAILMEPIPDPLWVLLTAAVGYVFGRQTNNVGITGPNLQALQDGMAEVRGLLQALTTKGP